ncbi:MAG: hypothetical protein ACI4SH_02050 [Candidatus Scatosoma sp.]
MRTAEGVRRKAWRRRAEGDRKTPEAGGKGGRHRQTAKAGAKADGKGGEKEAFGGAKKAKAGGGKRR